MNTEDQVDPHGANEDWGDTAYCTQGVLPNPDNYIQEMVMEPPTEEQPTRSWPYEAHCREMHDLHDRLLGLEERWSEVKEELLEDNRESASLPKAMAPSDATRETKY